MTKTKKTTAPIDSVIQALKKYDNYLITSHVNPEPDALGSELAMYDMAVKLGKKATVINEEVIPECYSFFENASLIRDRAKPGQKFGAAIVVDCPTTRRAGKVKDLLDRVKPIINIDHHISNEHFGDYELVEPEASSTAEIIYNIYKRAGIPLSKKVANYIYMAILTDTGSFNYSNTSGKTHRIVSELLEYGIHPHLISNHIYENKRFEDIKLLGQVLDTLEIMDGGAVSYMYCTNKMIKDTGSNVNSTQEFVNFARSVQDVRVAVFIREEPNRKNHFKISLRSKGEISVNKIASNFGGGGHRNAAGCNIKGTLADVKQRVLRRVSEAINDE